LSSTASLHLIEYLEVASLPALRDTTKLFVVEVMGPETRLARKHFHRERRLSLPSGSRWIPSIVFHSFLTAHTIPRSGQFSRSEGYDDVVCGRSDGSPDTTRSTKRPSRTTPLPPVARPVRPINFPPERLSSPDEPWLSPVFSLWAAPRSYSRLNPRVPKNTIRRPHIRGELGLSLPTDAPVRTIKFPLSLFTVLLSLGSGQSSRSGQRHGLIRA
jgi:hypothetical protein